jgi:hypothetical protein
MWNKTSANEITIHRRHKHEAEMAVNDLMKRGYILSYPLTEKKANNTSLSGYNYRKGRYTSIQGSSTSVWFAKLKWVSNQ